jgi:DNA-directed RNA polymerase specialized sigma24 family protein
MAKLSRRQKLIVHLKVYEGLSYNEIASKLGMNYQSVNNLAFRTFRRLRNALSSLAVMLATQA